MTKFFEKSVDLRSRKAMTDFLANHFRYDTMNSWNRSSSYAHIVKVHRLGLTTEQCNQAHDILDADDSIWDDLHPIISAFTRQHGGRYTIGSNGRSGAIWSSTTRRSSIRNSSPGA